MPTLMISCFWTTDARDDVAYSGRMGHARSTLGKYGIDFEVIPSGFRDSDFCLSYGGTVATLDDCRELRAQMNAWYPNGDGRLPIAFVGYIDPSLTITAADGVTFKDNDLDDWLAFCLVSDYEGHRHWPDTLLHEICHASGSEHNEVKSPRNIMHRPRTMLRTSLTQTQQDKLTSAYFVANST
jgi:hypothetical protein